MQPARAIQLMLGRRSREIILHLADCRRTSSSRLWLPNTHGVLSLLSSSTLGQWSFHSQSRWKRIFAGPSQNGRTITESLSLWAVLQGV